MLTIWKSNLLERNAHRGVHLRIVLWDGNDVVVPAWFFSDQALHFHSLRALLGLYLSSYGRISHVSATDELPHERSVLSARYLHWVNLGPQKRDFSAVINSAFDLFSNFVTVGRVLGQNEWSGVLASLKLNRLQSPTAFVCWYNRFKPDWRVFNWWVFGWQTSITSWQPGNRTLRSVLTEKFLVSNRCIIELIVIVLRPVEELPVGWVHLFVVFAVLDIEVRDPAELAVDISLLCKLSVVRHTRSLHLVFFIRVELSLRMDKHQLLVFEALVKVLLWTERGQGLWTKHLLDKTCD